MSSEEWLTPLHIRDVVSDANARPSPYRVRPSSPPPPASSDPSRVESVPARPSANSPPAPLRPSHPPPPSHRIAPPFPLPHQEPVELAWFSKSRAGGDAYDKSQLKRYSRPSVPFDLGEGFSTFRDRDRGVARPAPLAPIFGALAAAGASDRELAAADVITWRGNFAKLLATPWNARDAWHMEAELCRGVVVLNVLEPPEALRREANRTDREALMSYWGFSFEEACTGGTYRDPIDVLDAYCTVVRAGVGRHRLVLGGEVDCWDGDREGLAGYVELKTTRVMDAASQVARFERDKLLKWWAQSFAVGVRRILVGFRDDAGAVRKLQTLDTLKLPGYAARHEGAWDPKTALRFADAFLAWIGAHLEALPERARVRVQYEPSRDRERVFATRADDLIPDFIPESARAALANAAALRERYQASGEPAARKRGGERAEERERGARGGASGTAGGRAGEAQPPARGAPRESRERVRYFERR